MGLMSPRLISRRLIRGMRITIIVLALWLIVSWAVAYRLTRRPHPWFAEPVPSVAWGEVEAHRLRSRDGHELGAWLVRGKDEAPSVLLLHGNGGAGGNASTGPRSWPARAAPCCSARCWPRSRSRPTS